MKKTLLIGAGLFLLPVALLAFTRQDEWSGSPVLGKSRGLYVRGEASLAAGTKTVTLPSWFEELSAAGNRTVQLTCKGGHAPLYAGAVENGQFTVSTTTGGSQTQAFYWEVKADMKN